MIDLHVHSTESDGTDTPLELVALAKQVGLHAFALTDHDTISGLKYARPAAEEAGIELVPGIELSTDYEGKEVHILGYYIDENNPDFLKHLHTFVNSRDLRNEKMTVLLQKEGFAITMNDLYRENPESVITVLILLKYLVEHRMVKDVKPCLRSISETDAAAMCHAKKSIRLRRSA